MSELHILPSDHPALRSVCKPVTVDDDISFLKSELERLCKLYRAAGLAANQLGIMLRVFVINDGEIKTYINPEIIESSDQFFFNGEGCLSFPGEVLCTERFRKITIVSDSRPDEILTGIAAVAAQHELDHLNGITMHDRSIYDSKKNDT